MNTVKINFVVAGFIQNEAGDFCIAERPAHKTMPGFWEFPGGKVDKGETPEQALIRELREELGLSLQENDIAPLTFITHSYPEFHLFMPLYRILPRNCFPHPQENQQIAWANWENVNTYNLLPADIPLVEFLKKINKVALI